MKNTFLFILYIAFFSSEVTAQEINKVYGDYNYDINYIKSSGVEISEEETSVNDIILILYLDEIAFKEVSKIMVSLDSISEKNFVTGRSIHYNFEDRILGWETAINRRSDLKTIEEKQDVLQEVKANDKVNINQENYQVEIDFGSVKEIDREHKISVKLEYKDKTVSPPLSLNKALYEGIK